MAVTTETRSAIWNAIHDAARWGRYYGTLAGRYRRREWFVRSVLLMSALGSITALVSAMPESVQRLAGGAVGVAIIIDIVFHPSQTAAVLARIRDECDQDRIALDELWRDLPTIGEDEARRRFESLNRHLGHVTANVPVPDDDAVNESSSRAALQELDSLRDSLVRARAEAHGN